MLKKIKRKIKDQKPLTLEKLTDYNKKVLIPSLKEIFVTKDEFMDFKDEFGSFKDEFGSFKDEFGSFKDEFMDFKDEFRDFKDEAQKNFDKIFQKLDILLDEKTVRAHQEEKQKKLWLIVLKALKDHKILTAKELDLIAKLEIF